MEDGFQVSMTDSSLRNFAREVRLSVIKSVLTDEHASRLSQIVDSLQNLLAVIDAKDAGAVSVDPELWVALLKAVTEEVMELQNEIRAGIETC